ncbi:MAG: hypothetical protein NT026_00035, partial [Candidatus Staskawiczbacteria bacterium]|nr:hypothetical protein [Candidatus Staskawiczbacteria bacterium]
KTPARATRHALMEAAATTARKIPISNARAIIYTGMTRAETSKAANIARTVARETHVQTTTAPRIRTKDARAIIYIGMIPAETSKAADNIARMDATTIRVETIIIHMEIALITHTNFVREAIFIGTTPAELSKIFIKIVLAQI